MSFVPRTHHINLDVPDKEIRSGHLRLGGCDPQGEQIGVTSYTITRQGQPWIIISGEFHFSRFPRAYWQEELLKIKAGGINTVPFYLFWNHHEEQEGVFDWSGGRDVRAFVELIARCGLKAIARVGPFAHGECRNGGLPDWLYGQPFEVRSNHPAYLAYVERYYQQVGAQLRGLFFKDGGPIIGLQLDNEYEHCGAPWDAADRNFGVEWIPAGRDGAAHLRALRKLAEGAGMSAPLLTFTAWGSPIIEGESLPLQGGYAYPVWIDLPEPSPYFMFLDWHRNPPIDQGVQYTPSDYPVCNAEMQGGIQVRANNRPVVPPRSSEALALVRLGSGSNFLGYYMYHGGSHPEGARGRMNEMLHPQVSYDFQAPIGEYGEVRDACRYLKTLHHFIQSFGVELGPMGTVLPPEAIKLTPRDTHTLRWCVRSMGGTGFVFLNNFQDHLEMPAQENFRLELALSGETVTLPHQGALSLMPDVCCILPFNLRMDGACLKYATLQPLSILPISGGHHYFFFAPEGISPEYCFVQNTLSGLTGDVGETRAADGCVYLHPRPGFESSFSFQSPSGSLVRVTTLTRWEAEHAWRGMFAGQERLVISAADVIFDMDAFRLSTLAQAPLEVSIFPVLDRAPQVQTARLEVLPGVGNFSRYRIHFPTRPLQFQIAQVGEGKYTLDFAPDLLEGLGDAFLVVDYDGDSAGAFISGRLVADHYNNGTPWVVGLKRFFPLLAGKQWLLRFRPLRKGKLLNVSSAMAPRMQFEGEQLLRLNSIHLLGETCLWLRA